MKDDDPSALTNVLRHIYKVPIIPDPDCATKWRAWLNIRVTADKYLEHELGEAADKMFREAALACTQPDDIFDVVDMIRTEMNHDQPLNDFGNMLRRKNHSKLLRNTRFREDLDLRGKEGLWELIDELAFTTELKEKRYHLCDSHEKKVFQEPSAHKQSRMHCAVCEALSGSDSYNSERV